jgi:lipoic acid synthetase
MVGLGEEKHEVEQALTDLRAVGCRAITIGQYLQPRGENLPVSKYIEPEVFELYKSMAINMGFEFVESGPLVRSSYHAEETAKGGGSGQTHQNT